MCSITKLRKVLFPPLLVLFMFRWKGAVFMLTSVFLVCCELYGWTTDKTGDTRQIEFFLFDIDTFFNCYINWKCLMSNLKDH